MPGEFFGPLGVQMRGTKGFWSELKRGAAGVERDFAHFLSGEMLTVKKFLLFKTRRLGYLRLEMPQGEQYIYLIVVVVHQLRPGGSSSAPHGGTKFKGAAITANTLLGLLESKSKGHFRSKSIRMSRSVFPLQKCPKSTGHSGRKRGRPSN